MIYPIGIQDFGKLRRMGFAYVDKTMYVRKMISSPAYYFLSRPRRFGKSLFLTTLEAYFKGERELFSGLDIDTDEVDWQPRAVIKLAFNTVDTKDEKALTDYLEDNFSIYESLYGKNPEITSLSKRFELILKNAFAATGRQAVVLVDEYDAPLLNTLDNELLNQSYRETLKSIFSVLKNSDEYIFMAFITGVSRFSHTSLFSGANQLEDISLDDRYAAICGISEEELKANFMPGIREFAQKERLTDLEMLSLLKENYDGYHFSSECPDIYNPFSLLRALKSQKLDDYWFQSGTPTYLIQALRRDGFFLPDLDCIETLASGLSARESYLNNPVSLLYESGYVTIKGYDDEMESYSLGLPNMEVAKSFSEAFLPIYAEMPARECNDALLLMRRGLVDGDADRFMRHLQTFLCGNPYSNGELARRENYFKTAIFLVLKALGFMPRAEEQTCRSRMDVMMRTRRFLYIFELKTDGDTDTAMAQIEDRGYALPYADEGRRIIRIAASYDSARNNIGEWMVGEK